MDKRIKEAIAQKKITDEQLLELVTKFESASSADSEEQNTSESSSDATEDEPEVEESSTSPSINTPSNTKVDKTKGKGQTDDSLRITKDDLAKLVAEQVKAALKSQPEPKEQPDFKPIFENPKRPPQYKVLKRNG